MGVYFFLKINYYAMIVQRNLYLLTTLVNAELRAALCDDGFGPDRAKYAEVVLVVPSAKSRECT